MSSLLERQTNSLASEGRPRLRLAAGRRRRVEEHGASWSSMVMGFELAGCSCRYSYDDVWCHGQEEDDRVDLDIGFISSAWLPSAGCRKRR